MRRQKIKYLNIWNSVIIFFNLSGDYFFDFVMVFLYLRLAFKILILTFRSLNCNYIFYLLPIKKSFFYCRCQLDTFHPMSPLIY